jgi:hypothetical protein
MDFDPFSKPSSPSIEIIEHILSIGILALSGESQTAIVHAYFQIVWMHSN